MAAPPINLSFVNSNYFERIQQIVSFQDRFFSESSNVEWAKNDAGILESLAELEKLGFSIDKEERVLGPQGQSWPSFNHPKFPYLSYENLFTSTRSDPFYRPPLEFYLSSVCHLFNHTPKLASAEEKEDQWLNAPMPVGLKKQILIRKGLSPNGAQKKIQEASQRFFNQPMGPFPQIIFGDEMLLSDM